MGFDAVIGNPPYIQLQRDGGELVDLYQDLGYQTFERTGDIYCLFYERAMQLLKADGYACLITSNKWMRAGYGTSTRAFLAQHNPLLMVDTSGTKVFENATVDTVIMLLQKASNAHSTVCYNGAEAIAGKEAAPVIMDFAAIGGGAWVPLLPVEQSIKQKIEMCGVPLREWDIQINRGIVTGCNEAFIVDEATRAGILAACKDEGERARTEELIRPILRGRDIKRYKAQWAGLYLIATFPSRHYDIEQYPAVKDYLLRFGKERLEQTGQTYTVNGERVKSRKKTGNKWFEMQDQIGYWQDFGKEKVVWTAVNAEYRFTTVPPNVYINNALFMITGKNIKTICAVANSRLFIHYLNLLLSTVYTYGSGIFFEDLPIVRPADTSAIDALVDKILAVKAADPAADTSGAERQIDEEVERLYGLTEEEIALLRPK